MLGLVPSCEKKTGEGEKIILGSFTKEASQNPSDRRLRGVFEHLDKKQINSVLTHKDIAGLDEDAGSDEVEVDGDLGKALGEITGIGDKTILGWFTRVPSTNPFNPSLSYLMEHLDKKKISAIMTRKDITVKEMNKLLDEELDACAPPYPEVDKCALLGVEEEDMDEDEDEEDMDEDEDEEDMDEDEDDVEEDMDEGKVDDGTVEVEAEGEMRKTSQLGDQEEHGVMKRPQLSLVQSEVECKKPRVEEGFGFHEGEPIAAEM